MTVQLRNGYSLISKVSFIYSIILIYTTRQLLISCVTLVGFTFELAYPSMNSARDYNTHTLHNIHLWFKACLDTNVIFKNSGIKSGFITKDKTFNSNSKFIQAVGCAFSWQIKLKCCLTLSLTYVVYLRPLSRNFELFAFESTYCIFIY